MYISIYISLKYIARNNLLTMLGRTQGLLRLGKLSLSLCPVCPFFQIIS